MAASVQKEIVRVRIAPSPTGPLHVGTAHTALFNWLFARQRKGIFILRIEDTDAIRSEKKYETQIFEGLNWLGLAWDEGPDSSGGKDRGAYGPYRQSERMEIYREHLEKLLAEKKAYFCYCTKEELESERQFFLSQGLPPKYGGHCRNLTSPPAGREPQVIRFKVTHKKVECKDFIRGKVSFDAALFGDIVIARIEKKEHAFVYLPLYNFVAVVDDALMKITHVIRGEDHLSNTPKQMLIFEAFGFSPPYYAHLPLILNPDRSKMSKRYADTALLDYREKGFVPDAIVNFLALLGWHPKDHREILSREELIKEFDITRIQKAGAIFNQEKLDWLNREHVKRMDGESFFMYGEELLGERGTHADKKLLRRIFDAERERFKNFTNLWEEIAFFFDLPEYDGAMLVPGQGTRGTSEALMNEILVALKAIPDILWQRNTIRDYLEKISERGGRGEVYWPFRVALSGKRASPDPLEIAEILGKEESLRRIEIALRKLAADK